MWCYLFGIAYPAFYLLSVPRKKQSQFLRFHCIQCIFLFLFWTPFPFLDVGPAYISLSGFLLGLAGWVTAMIQARRGKVFHLPLIGLVADRLV